jgi:uncharacterized protein (DUF1778 family)
MGQSARKDDENPLVPTGSAAQWNAQGWSDMPEELSSATKLETMISVRFDADAATSVRKAARLQGISRSEFVRRAALAEANRITRDANRQPIVVKRIAPVLEPVVTGETDAGRTRSVTQTVENAAGDLSDEGVLTGTQ